MKTEQGVRYSTQGGEGEGLVKIHPLEIKRGKSGRWDQGKAVKSAGLRPTIALRSSQQPPATLRSRGVAAGCFGVPLLWKEWEDGLSASEQLHAAQYGEKKGTS